MIFDTTIKNLLGDRLRELELHVEADVVFYYGIIDFGLVKEFRDFIEKLNDGSSQRRLAIVLNTPGGSAEAAEKMVEIVRFHYDEVYFIVPDYAMSAGTIFCMSGDKIFMDYSSSLGPIDPQVQAGGTWVPAMGYLEKVEQLLEKAKQGTLTHAEFLILQSIDLAMLSRYEQARDLTVTLLKSWLVRYKFKDWTVHRTNPAKLGSRVTSDEKMARAEEIARHLGDHKHWHSHGRMISATTATTYLRLEIDDYSSDTTLRTLIRSYNDLAIEYILRNDYKLFLHSRNYF